jgi:hypothetical protein
MDEASAGDVSDDLGGGERESDLSAGESGGDLADEDDDNDEDPGLNPKHARRRHTRKKRRLNEKERGTEWARKELARQAEDMAASVSNLPRPSRLNRLDLFEHANRERARHHLAAFSPREDGHLLEDDNVLTALMALAVDPFSFDPLDYPRFFLNEADAPTPVIDDFQTYIRVVRFSTAK